MINRFRGDVGLIINGEAVLMRLSLEALLALEDMLESKDFPALVKRFESSKPCTQDIISVLQAGLIGGGYAPEAFSVKEAEIEGGALAALHAAQLLLVRAFQPGAEKFVK